MSDNKTGWLCSGSLICLLQVWLQAELEDIKYYYQLIIKVTISEKRRIAKICNLDCWHKHLCHRINKITGPLKYCHCSRGEKNLHFEGSPNLGVYALFLWWLKPRLCLVDLNYNFECGWLIELSDNKRSNKNLASELVENRSL